MSTRVGFWVAGALAGGSLAWALRPYLTAGALLLGFGACTLLAGLIGELLHALRTIRSAGSPTPPDGARPADGQVDLLEMAGTRGDPNGRDPRFSAFRSLDAVKAPGTTALPRARVSPPLLGTIAIVSAFVGRHRRPWSDSEIAQAHAALLHAGEWIEREAIRWAAPLNIALASTYFVAEDDSRADDVEMMFVPEGDTVGPLEARAVTKALIDSSRVAAQLGFRDAVDWWAQIKPRLEADVLVWLLHPRCAGRSLAIPLDQTELSGVSLAVCYARESSFPEPLAGPPFTDPVTVVHELLHLFGASDKYGVPLRDYPPGSVTSRDVMRLNETRLSRLRIDPRTAWEVGWVAGR